MLVAMSGGVDSSVAAALLRERGHDLVGVTFHLWDAAGSQKVGRCCAPEDREDARRTCDHLGIPHYVIDEREAFARTVVQPFVEAYAEGRTPSPCVQCNQHVKLQRLLEVADDLGATHLATGHYARLRRSADGVRLLRGVDRAKDQSYFLYGVSQAVLSRMLLPLGGLAKGQTREQGRRLAVPNWDKPDSQELCFVPDGDIGAFLEARGVPGAAGPVVDQSGAVLGTHSGSQRFTVGQRRGLRLGGQDAPRYVLRVVPERNEVVVGTASSLYASTARAVDARWTTRPPDGAFRGEVQVRYRHRPAPGRVRPGAGSSTFEVAFDEPQRAIAPGQAAVVYRGEEVIGGGRIAA